MCKKRIGILFVAAFFMFFTFLSSISVSAKDEENNSWVETENNAITTTAEEESHYDEIITTESVAISGEMMESNGYVRVTEAEKQAIVGNDPYGTCIELGQIPDYYLPETEEGGVSTFALQSGYTDSFQTLTIIGKKYSNTDFTDILDNSDVKISTDATGVYASLQGGCFDGTNYYFGFLLKNSLGSTVDARILRGNFDSDGNFVKTALAVGLLGKLQHVNDLTYNKDTGEIVVVCSEDNYHNKIFTISKNAFSSSTVAGDFEEHLLPCMVTAIDYNATRSQYVARLSGCANGYAILDADFNLVKTFGYSNADSNHWVTQGICADNLYIYSLSYYNPADKTLLDEVENRLRIFDWNGNLIKSFEFYINKHTESQTLQDARIYEFENIIIANDRILVGASCIQGQQSRSFSYLDMSKWTYYMQFCPDEQVDSYAGQYGNGNVTAVMFRDLATPLRKFRVAIDNKKFVGWTAYRVEDQTWLYCNADRSIKKWCTAGNQPTGYTKYVYADKQVVSQTGEVGDHVLMCAQWETTSTFTVSFMKNGGSGTMTDQLVTYGTTTALKSNTFTKTNRSFTGWNAYWSEKNRWYYVSADGSTKGWYKEGYEPAGYKKYTYTEGQNVAKTVYPGGHVYMYALWNEYYIQYALNQEEAVTTNKMINYSQILEQHTALYATEAENDLLIYSNPYVCSAGEGYNQGSIYLSGYNLYRKEIDKWMYINGSTKGWYTYGSAPSGYTLYERTVLSEDVYLGATALPGEHLVLVAVWSDS